MTIGQMLQTYETVDNWTTPELSHPDVTLRRPCARQDTSPGVLEEFEGCEYFDKLPAQVLGPLGLSIVSFTLRCRNADTIHS
jgi:hypothetical protein